MKKRTRKKPLHRNVHKTSQFLFILLGLAGILIILVNFHFVKLNQLSQPETPPTPVYQKPTAKLLLLPSSTQEQPLEVKLYTTFDVQVQLDPMAHKVSVVHPVIDYDASVVKVVSVDIDNQDFPMTLQKADMSHPGMLTFGVAINPPLDNAITKPTTVATIHFRTLKSVTSPAAITFDNSSSILSVSPLDAASANVLASTSPLYFVTR